MPDNTPMTPLEQWMRDNDVRAVTRVPPSDLLPHEVSHVRLNGWHLSEDIGRGATVKDALHDAHARQYGEAA